MLERHVGAALLAVVAGQPLAALAAGPAVDWSSAQRIEVVMTNYRFDPNAFHFRRGVAYHLHLENHGTELHEYGAPAFFKSAELRDPSVLNRDRTEVEVPPGAQRDLYFVALKAGTFPLTCPDHDWAGMVGTIVVE